MVTFPLVVTVVVAAVAPVLMGTTAALCWRSQMAEAKIEPSGAMTKEVTSRLGVS